jgi:predicted nucleotidyltransferase
MKDLSQDFQELIELLTSHGVEFIIVGAYALAYLGHTRYTEDIDFWIRRTRENARRTADALKEFGITLDDNAVDQLTEDRKLLQFGVKPQRVDILTFLDGCDFDTAVERASESEAGDVPVKFLSLEDYVLTKLASGRRKDLRDLEDLREAIGRPLPGDPA